MVDLLWMTIHLGVKDRALLSEWGLRVRNTVLRELLKLLKQGGQWTGTNCGFTIKNNDGNSIPPRHKRTVEKCVSVCLSVCVNSSLSHLVEFKIPVFQNTLTPEAVWLEDESVSDSPTKEQSAACLLSLNNSNAPVEHTFKQFQILCVMNLNFFKPARRPISQCSSPQWSPLELENRGVFHCILQGQTKQTPVVQNNSYSAYLAFLICGGFFVCFPEDLPFKDKSVPAWQSFKLRESQFGTAVSSDGPIHHFP